MTDLTTAQQAARQYRDAAEELATWERVLGKAFVGQGFLTIPALVASDLRQGLTEGARVLLLAARRAEGE